MSENFSNKKRLEIDKKEKNSSINNETNEINHDTTNNQTENYKLKQKYKLETGDIIENNDENNKYINKGNLELNDIVIENKINSFENFESIKIKEKKIISDSFEEAKKEISNHDNNKMILNKENIINQNQENNENLLKDITVNEDENDNERDKEQEDKEDSILSEKVSIIKSQLENRSSKKTTEIKNRANASEMSVSNLSGLIKMSNRSNSKNKSNYLSVKTKDLQSINDRTMIYLNSYRSYWEKFQRINFFEFEFENTFNLSCDVEYKEMIGFNTYRMKLNKNKLVLFNRIPSNKNKGKYKIYEDQFKKTNMKIIDQIPYLVLDFDFISCEVKVFSEKSLVEIYVFGSSKVFIFKIEERKLFELFIVYLHYFIGNSEGFKEKLFSIVLREDFYKNYFITESQFKNNAKTGDILIFKGFEITANCQRCITCENYGKLLI